MDKNHGHKLQNEPIRSSPLCEKKVELSNGKNVKWKNEQFGAITLTICEPKNPNANGIIKIVGIIATFKKADPLELAHFIFHIITFSIPSNASILMNSVRILWHLVASKVCFNDP